MKTLKLSILERLWLEKLLPQEGGKIEMLTVMSIIEKTRFTEKEISEFELKDVPNGGISWNNGREVGFEFSIEQVDILKEASRQADVKKLIKWQENLSLITKIDDL